MSFINISYISVIYANLEEHDKKIYSRMKSKLNSLKKLHKKFLQHR